jgi:hypothetical protein
MRDHVGGETDLATAYFFMFRGVYKGLTLNPLVRVHCYAAFVATAPTSLTRQLGCLKESDRSYRRSNYVIPKSELELCLKSSHRHLGRSWPIV